MRHDASTADEIDPIARARAAVDRNPSDASLHASLAALLHEAGDLERASESVQRALYLDRFHEDALMLAAQLADARGASADAERLRLRALRAHLGKMRDEDTR